MNHNKLTNKGWLLAIAALALGCGTASLAPERVQAYSRATVFDGAGTHGPRRRDGRPNAHAVQRPRAPRKELVRPPQRTSARR